MRLQLECGEQFSSFAFNFNLRRYATVDDALDSLIMPALNKGIELICVVDPRLPAKVRPCRLNPDGPLVDPISTPGCPMIDPRLTPG
jgi:hypothetical protein